MNFILSIVAFLSLAQSYAAAYEMEDVQRIDFEVRDPESRKLFFNGYENITQTAGKTRKEAWYFDLAKKEMQYENVVYDNKDLRVESYLFRNPITGETTDLTTAGRSMQIKYRPNFSKSFKDGTLNWSENAYHGKVFNNLILRNWTSLLAGQNLNFDLVLPYRFETLSFQIVHKGTSKVAGEDREMFVLQPSSLIIRALAPRIEFQYSKGEKPRIRQFTGPCTIPIEGKTDRIVDIIFDYPKPS